MEDILTTVLKWKVHFFGAKFLQLCGIFTYCHSIVISWHGLGQLDRNRLGEGGCVSTHLQDPLGEGTKALSTVCVTVIISGEKNRKEGPLGRGTRRDPQLRGFLTAVQVHITEHTGSL